MATSSRRPSFGNGSQACGTRQHNHTVGTGPPPHHHQQQQQQQQHATSQRAMSAHGHQPSINGGNLAVLNTEVRAQARRERDAVRIQSKEKMQQQTGAATNGGINGRERSSSVLSTQVQGGGERRISPKMVTKSSTGLDNARRTTVARHGPKSSNGLSAGEQQQAPPFTQHQMGGQPPTQHISSLSYDRYASDERQHFGDLANRIPGPPKGDETRSEFDSMQTAYFVKYYYDMVEKCHSWQRYASNLKAKGETIEIENRILKEINEKQDRDIRLLEMEVASLKQASMVHEHERRRAESKLSCYSHGLSPTNSSGELSNRYLRQASSNIALQAVEVGIDAMSIPSPPTSGRGNRLVDASHLTVAANRLPYCSSNMHTSEVGETGESIHDLRPPTPTSAVSLPHSLQAILHSGGEGELGDRRQQASRRGHRHSDSNAGEIVAQDAANREAGAGSSYEHEMQISRVERQWQRQRYAANMTASNTFPPADVTPSAALTMQALAAMNVQSQMRQQHHTLPTSSSVPQLPSEIWDRPLSPDRVAKRQVSAGDALILTTKRRNTTGDDDDESEWEGLEASNRLHVPGHGAQGRVTEDEGQGNAVARGGSALSDALTVTEDYLQDIVEQKRRLRKVSLSQQQQLHYLQARIHLHSSASQASLPGVGNGGVGGGSRPSSRLSNHGIRGKARSRAGSYTVHDSIPVAKDDLFSSDSAGPAKKSATTPLSAIDVNRLVPNTATVPDDEEDSSFLAKEGSFGIQEGEEDPLDLDPKGAHRRLYIRLRDELQTADLVRFERYVHRYDALEIGIDGSRGIINRVRRLLLPDELVRSKTSVPERYRARKELAREFERIVREDAIPKEGNETQTIGDAHSDISQA